MQNDSSTGSPQRDQIRNSRAANCAECKNVFEPVVLGIQLPGLRFADFTGKICSDCIDKAQSKYEGERRRAEDAERNRQRVKKSLEVLGGVKPYEDFTLAKFNRELNPAAYDRAANFEPARDNLFFYGKNRLGKTHLGTAIAHKFIDLGKSAIVRSMPDLVSDLRKFESNGDFDGEDKYINRIAKLDIFVLDDIGLGNATEYIVKILWQILTLRMNNRRNGLVITSNLTLNDLNVKYGRKIPSRIFEMTGPNGLVLFDDEKTIS